ncbi:MAG: hypothetical protein OCC45_15725 [Desulfotalea sp.]
MTSVYWTTGALVVFCRITRLSILPQENPERAKRAKAMLTAMDCKEFDNCSNAQECEQQCPKGISIRNIARFNWEYLKAVFTD